MVRRTASYFALISLCAAYPAMAEDTLLVADAASSKSRAEARHDTSGDSVSASTSSRSKARRATRGSAASNDTVVATQNRGKRSRRNPGQQDLAAPMVASNGSAETGLLALAANRDVLAQHVQSADFSGQSGALALYHLIGKAVADMPLDAAETQALTVAIDGTDLPWLIADTEARLSAAAAEGETLEKIAEELGIPRPVVKPGTRQNLGANLILDTEVSPG